MLETITENAGDTGDLLVQLDKDLTEGLSMITAGYKKSRLTLYNLSQVWREDVARRRLGYSSFNEYLKHKFDGIEGASRSNLLRQVQAARLELSAGVPVNTLTVNAAVQLEPIEESMRPAVLAIARASVSDDSAITSAVINAAIETMTTGARGGAVSVGGESYSLTDDEIEQTDPDTGEVWVMPTLDDEQKRTAVIGATLEQAAAAAKEEWQRINDHTNPALLNDTYASIDAVLTAVVRATMETFAAGRTVKMIIYELER